MSFCYKKGPQETDRPLTDKASVHVTSCSISLYAVDHICKENKFQNKKRMAGGAGIYYSWVRALVSCLLFSTIGSGVGGRRGSIIITILSGNSTMNKIKILLPQNKKTLSWRWLKFLRLHFQLCGQMTSSAAHNSELTSHFLVGAMLAIQLKSNN